MLLLLLVLFADSVSQAAGQDCITVVNNCTSSWKAAMSVASGNIDDECSAVIVYGACLKNSENLCSADEKASIEKLLNKDVLPVLSNQCQAQSCEVEFAGCTNAWKTATAGTTDVASRCRESEEYMTCLLGIESTCTPDQVNTIRAILNDIGPKVNQNCKGEDCTTQTNMCTAVWNVSLSDTRGNLPLTCNAYEAFDVCLRSIEVECSAQDKYILQTLSTKIENLLYTKCHGFGCTPLLYECTSNVNQTIQLAQTTTDQCRVYQTYQQCLTNTAALCNTDEKTTVDNDLKIIRPLITQLCTSPDSSVSKVVVSIWLTLFVLFSSAVLSL